MTHTIPYSVPQDKMQSMAAAGSPTGGQKDRHGDERINEGANMKVQGE
jgi:hypothetical protein